MRFPQRLIERFNEWRWRVQVGDKRAQAYFYGVLFGTILFLADWAGWRGAFGPWGGARPFGEIWWHFPALIGFVFVLFRFFRF